MQFLFLTIFAPSLSPDCSDSNLTPPCFSDITQRKGAPTQRPRPRSTNEQRLADAPSRGGRAKHCFTGSRATLRLRLVVSLEADLTLSRRSSCLHGRSTALWSFLVRFSHCSKSSWSGSPASFQSSDSIIQGPKARNYPRSGIHRGLAGIVLTSTSGWQPSSGP